MCDDPDIPRVTVHTIGRGCRLGIQSCVPKMSDLTLVLFGLFFGSGRGEAPHNLPLLKIHSNSGGTPREALASCATAYRISSRGKPHLPLVSKFEDS